MGADILKKLWKRRVVQFGALYLGVSWLLLQVAVALEQTLKLPDWADQLVLVLLLVGFPLVLILAWAQGTRSEDTKSPDEGAKTTSIEQVSDDLSVVVLPFRARASDEVEQLTAEGLTDDITTLLTSVKGIKVAPRQAVGRTLEAGQDALQIARDLGSRYALTGSVRRVGDQLRVSTELTNIEDREQKWSQKFDRSADDIFAIQDEIAKGVVGTLGGVITRVEAARALRQPPENLQAWELTRRALAATWDWRPDTVARGVQDARRAIELDPDYDLAHGVLAMYLGWRAAHGWAPDVAAEREEAFYEADQAVRLGFDNAEALWGALHANWANGRPEVAIRIYEDRIARRPDLFLSYPFSIVSASVAYARAGRAEEGLALLKTFEDMFPDDALGAIWTRPFRGYAELACRNYAEAAKLHANPPSEYNGMCRVVALMNLDDVDEAKAEFARLERANSAINLDHYIEHFKGYHVDKAVGQELSDGLARLKAELASAI